MKSAKIAWQSSGEPVSQQFNDIYFSKTGGLDETKYVFLEHNQLEKRFLYVKDHFVIAETGFGTGLNFLATLSLWQSRAPKSAKLFYYSAEKYPLNKDDLKKALTIWLEFKDISDQLIQSYPETLYEGCYPIDMGNVQLILLFGDAKDVFKKVDIKIDAWFLDGFAPSKNESMWSKELFSQIAKTSQNNTTFATFTAASSVRKGLEKQGFKIQKDKGFGYKREMLYGSFKTDRYQHPKTKPWFSPKKAKRTINSVAIIGGGLAGCAIAYELSKENIQSTIYEKASNIASGASGNPVGMARPYITKDFNESDQFHSAGFILLEQFMHQHCNDINFNQLGLLQVINKKDQAWFNQLQNNRELSHNIIQLIDNEKASQLSHIAISKKCFYYPKCFSINPKNLCQLWISLANDNVQVLTNHKVLDIKKDEQGWQLEINTGLTEKYDAVIIAGGYHSIKNFEQTKHLDVFASVGQVTSIKADLPLQMMISDGGYLVPGLNDNEFILGATYRDNNDFTVDTRASDDLSNTALLKKLNIDENHYEVIDSRASMRCVTSDHMPLIGQVPDLIEYQNLYQHHLAKGTPWWKIQQPKNNDGLYIASGFGSKGLSSSLISAKIIRNLINNEPLYIPYNILQAVNPARFIVRKLKSSRQT